MGAAASSSQVLTGPEQTTSSGQSKTWEEEEKQRIDDENRQRLADMSPQEIEEERRELMESLSPAFLQRLLQRSNINAGSAETDLTERKPAKAKSASKTKAVTFAEAEPLKDAPVNTTTAVSLRPSDLSNNPTNPTDATSPLTNNDYENNSTTTTLPSHAPIHFPRPSQPPPLDPLSPTFTHDLHSKYFPHLPHSPSELAWLQPLPTTTSTTPTYHPDLPTLHPRHLRFDFTGALLPPRSALSIPVSAGLHHHGADPEAAGYTLSELALLARSTFPAQRCLAFQTLGRILFRLGRGEFGDEGVTSADEGTGANDPRHDDEGEGGSLGDLARGLWREVEKEKVLDILVRESMGDGVDGGRHVSARAYAVEAVWAWRRGGGRRWKAE